MMKKKIIISREKSYPEFFPFEKLQKDLRIAFLVKNYATRIDSIKD